MRLVYIAICWAAGIVLSAEFDVLAPLLWVAFCIVALIAVYVQQPGYRFYFVLVLVFGLGGLRHAWLPTTSDVAQYNNTGGLTLEGQIVSTPDIRDDRTLFRLKTDTLIRGAQVTPTSGDVLVRAARHVDVAYGDRVAVTGQLIQPGEYDLFSYADYLGRQGVFSIIDHTAVTVLSHGHGVSILFTLRERVQTLIAAMLPEPHAGLLTGIVVGNERGISPELERDFQAVGASHIIAISGFNMVIIAGVVRGLLGGLRKYWLTVLSIGVIVLYAFFVGADAAVLRATIMVSVYLIGTNLRRKTYVPASLAFTALLMSVHDPNVIWDVSFQLSFFATLGLSLFADPLKRWLDILLQSAFPLKYARRVSTFLTEPLVVTIAAQITTLPLILLYFGRLSVVSLLVNLLIIPVQAYLLILGLVAVLVAFVLPMVGQVLFWLDLVLLNYSIWVVRMFGRLPFADTAIFVRPELIQGFFIVLIGGAMIQATQPRWWRWLKRGQHQIVSATALAGIGIVFLVGSLWNSRPDGSLHIWFLAVGHSNGILMQTPGGAHILVDGGRFPSRLLTAIGDHLPFTDRTLELVFITQPDAFDYGALSSVFDRYEVGKVLTNGQPNLSREYQALMPTDPLIVENGYTIELSDGVRIEVLHPQKQPTIHDSLNDTSLVLRVTYGDVSFLLTGDMSADAQTELLKSGGWPVATVMQLPQHGRRRALVSDFLDVVQPRVIVLQADPANRWGDPDADLTAMLPEAVPVFRTDLGGTAHFWTDGLGLVLSSARFNH